MATSRAPKRSGGGTKKSVEPDTIQMPAADGDINKLRRYHAEIGEILARMDAERSPFDKVSGHVRRHLPLYALAAVFALVIILIPTANDRTRESAAEDITAGDTSADLGGSLEAAGPGGVQGGSRQRNAGPTTRPGSGVASTVDRSKPIGVVQQSTGKTIAGVDCRPGVRQVPFSKYAAPCIARFTGNNGGATFRGVTDKTIKVVVRATSDANSANAQTVDQVNKQAGRATRGEALALLQKWTNGYFSKVYDLYGRKLEFVRYNSRVSNGTDEAQGKNKEGACADATDIIKDVKGFMVITYSSDFGMSQPFTDCGVEKGGILMPLASAYFPESWYTERWSPYAYHIAMECEQITQDVAEYIGERLWNRNAKWAADVTYQAKKRVIGLYVPDNDGYQHCVNIHKAKLKKDYNATYARQFNYQLDVARFPDQAAQAVPQFQAAGVTTLVNACDTISTTFLTQQAEAQRWGPEWLLIGVALQDRAGNARLFNQNRVDGHMFGMSQLGKTSTIYGKEGEAYKAWKLAFPKEEPPRGYADVYYYGVHFFNLLQVAGPVLTPANVEKGLQAMPPGGGAKGAFGTWAFKGDHTAIDDSREIYWVCKHDTAASCTGPRADDGGLGEFLETYGGKRFGTGQWPKEEPPIYPKG